jgi:hypothetical protein
MLQWAEQLGQLPLTRTHPLFVFFFVARARQRNCGTGVRSSFPIFFCPPQDPWAEAINRGLRANHNSNRRARGPAREAIKGGMGGGRSYNRRAGGHLRWMRPPPSRAQCAMPLPSLLLSQSQLQLAAWLGWAYFARKVHPP